MHLNHLLMLYIDTKGNDPNIDGRGRITVKDIRLYTIGASFALRTLILLNGNMTNTK